MLGERQLGFGKYKDWTMEEVYDQDKGYIEYIKSSSDDLSPRARDLVDYANMRDKTHLVESGATEDSASLRLDASVFNEQQLGETRVGFGKHSGLTNAEVYQQHYGYIEFLRSCTDLCPEALDLCKYADVRDRAAH